MLRNNIVSASQVLIITLLVIVSGCQPPRMGKLGGTEKDEIEVTIVHMNDVYEIAPLEGGGSGGLARVAHLYNRLQSENPNTILVLAGDFLSPSLLSSMLVDGEKLQGRQMVEVLNTMGMDLVTFGNHEFDLDRHELQNRINESEFMWVSANVKEVTPEGIKPFEKRMDGEYNALPEELIIDLVDRKGNPYRLGIVSVTLPFNRAGYVHYDDIYTSAEEIFDSLNKVTDLVLGLTHLNMEQDIKLAKRLPEIPLIMGGHDHQNMYEQVGDTPIAKADANARTVYIHRLVYNFELDSLRITSELKEIDASIKEDSLVASVVDKWMMIADRTFEQIGFEGDEVLMISEETLDGREISLRNHPTNLGKMVAEAVLWAAHDADAAIVNSGAIRLDDRLQGEITQYDVLRMLPFGGRIAEVEMSGDLLIRILDVGRNNKGSGGYLQWAGIQSDSRRGLWFVEDKEIIFNQYYTVAMPEFLLTGMEKGLDFLTEDNPGIKKVTYPKADDKDDPRSDIRKAVISYFRMTGER